MSSEILYYSILFFIYSYLGATLEHLNYFFSKKKKGLNNLIITGFPLYGLCALLITSIRKKFNIHNIILQIIIYGSIVTLLELIVGLYIGAGEKSYTQHGYVNAWDYSDNYIHYKGIISLDHFLMWGVLGLLVVYIDKYISQFVERGLTY